MVLDVKSNAKYTIKKTTMEQLIFISLFILSFFHQVTLLIYFIGLLFLLKQKEIGIIKVIILLTFRSILNPNIAVNFGKLQLLKWIYIIGGSIVLLSYYFKLDSKTRKQLASILLTISVFAVYNVIIAFLFSSLPIVATFKVFSYVLVFTGIMVGTALSYERINWFDWLDKWFRVLVVLSFIVLPLQSIINTHGANLYQGVVNHPNLFGVTLVLYIAILLFKNKPREKFKKTDFIFLVLTFIMIILSNSRTSLLGVFILLGIKVLIRFFSKLTLLKASMAPFTLGGVLLVLGPLMGFFVEFMTKGRPLGDLFVSREAQFSGLMHNFSNRPLFGNGFNVPVLPYRTFDFSFEYVVEPGNLILAVLSFSGIVGFIIFIVYMLQILFSNKDNLIFRPYLFLAPILISMGEMVFFSSNSIGTLCYLLLALHIFENNNNHNE